MNEFREDPLSGEWVIIAPGRAARPHEIGKGASRRKPAPKAGCPFEDLRASGNWPPIIAYPNLRNWRAVVIPNKYPALAHGKVCAASFRYAGIYEGKTGVGTHELVVTRDHRKNFAELSLADATGVMRLFQRRAAAAAKDPCLVYMVPICNWGPAAGASIWHPHYQILGTPFVPSVRARSVEHSERYFAKHRRCLRCDLIKVERREKARVVAENRNAIALAPYASKLPYEVRIVPKRHLPYFYASPASTVRDVAALLQTVMRRLKAEVSDPDLNFYIHEAPLDKKRYPHHHWHAEIFPRISIPAGFEFSTGMYINIVDPETAAATLRGAPQRSRANV